MILPVPSITSALKGQRFCDTNDVIINAMGENGFQECFQHFHSRWQKCVWHKGTVLKKM